MECGSSTMTLGRMKEVDFSNIIFAESTGVVVSRASKIQLFAEMTGKKIAVIAGTTNEQAIRDQSDQHHLNIVVVSVKDRDEGIGALESGKVDGYASDKLLLVGTQTKHPEALFMLPDDLSIEAYAITLPRGDWALRLAVNTGLAQIYRSGAIAVVFKRWFDQLGLKPGLLTEAAYALGGSQIEPIFNGTPRQVLGRRQDAIHIHADREITECHRRLPGPNRALSCNFSEGDSTSVSNQDPHPHKGCPSLRFEGFRC